ncbi:MAG: type IV toxin-antitoxin system AbiEi family antitoxin domain-containing protein [Bellilinea sp.]
MELHEKLQKVNTDGIIKTAELTSAGIYYADIQKLLSENILEKVRHGYYQLVSKSAKQSEAALIASLFPDGVLCMYSALFYYGYSDRTPMQWDIAVSKNISRARFNLDYPYVKPHYFDTKHLTYGISQAEYEDCTMRIFDRNRLICECIKRENRMDREIFNKAIQGYIDDAAKSIPKLLEYAKLRNVAKRVRDRIGVWL